MDELEPTAGVGYTSGTPQQTLGRAWRRVRLVDSFTVQPGERVLWCLRRRKTDVRCVLRALSKPLEIRVVQDRDLVLTEHFQDEWLAVNWAKIYAERLKQQGWFDSPGD
jgi:hypothetical protein